jgi:hypothetical protein
MAEMQRPRGGEKEKVDEKAVKLDKLKKLQELESKLQALEKSEAVAAGSSADAEEEGLDMLESSIQKGIQKATKGEKMYEIKVQDADIENELHALEKEIAHEDVVEVKTPFEQLADMHPWIQQAQYGFMYTIPNKKKTKQDFDSWKEEWTHVLLDYAKVGKFHIIFPKRLLTEPPFNKFQDRKGAVDELCEGLVERQLAKWLDKKKEQLRVFWKSMEEWVVVIEDWARDNALMEIIMVPEIRSADEEFSTLPEEDLYQIFKKIQQEQRGKLVELSKTEFGVKFNF